MIKLEKKIHLSQRFKKEEMRLSVVISITFLFLFIILSYGAIPEETNWEVGIVASKDVLADRSLTYEDNEETEKKRNEAIKKIDLVYKISTESFNSFTLADIDSAFVTLEKIVLEDKIKPEIERKRDLERLISGTLETKTFNNVLSLKKDDIERLHSLSVFYASQIMGKGISETELAKAKTEIKAALQASSSLNGEEKKFLVALMDKISLYPTAIYDKEATKEKEALVLKGIEPVSHTLKKGQTIVNKGDIVTKEQYQALLALGFTSDLPLWVYACGILLVLLVTFFLMYYYARYFSESKNEWQKTFKVFLVISTIEVSFMPVVFAINLGAASSELATSGYLLPVALGVMLVSHLRNQKDSLFMLLIFSLYLIVYAGASEFVLVAILGSLAGIAQTSRLSKRSDLLFVALSIALFNSLGVLVVGLLKAQSLEMMLSGLLYALGSGFLSVILTLGLLPYLEMVFKITTPMTLIELANPTQPLLKRLMQEAPGTYHHSLMVANLAETIADDLGANGLLVRVGAYYHDIGKLKRPAFFAENQFGQENVHDKISPMLSTLIITSHVKDGVQMAKEAGLPESVSNLIAEHHGNSMVGYFYMKAKAKDLNVNAEDFRYHQRKPQTKEAAILMIADTVEAAVRSKKGVTRGQISGFIRQLINAKLEDGQFEECPLTFKDLDRIRELCTQVMVGLYHQRVDYPSKEQLGGK